MPLWNKDSASTYCSLGNYQAALIQKQEILYYYESTENLKEKKTALLYGATTLFSFRLISISFYITV